MIPAPVTSWDVVLLRVVADTKKLSIVGDLRLSLRELRGAGWKTVMGDLDMAPDASWDGCVAGRDLASSLSAGF